METLDWKRLAKDVIPETGRVPYEPNKHLFTKVAFDVFQLNNAPIESLWILEEGDDGKQYLVARYEDEGQKSIEVKSSWLALADKEAKNITLLYKDIPIQRFASADYGFKKEDASIFQKMLIEKLNSDKTFVEKLIKNQPEQRRNLLLQQFPELA